MSFRSQRWRPTAKITDSEGSLKAFACGDVVPGCDARWVRPSEDEILEQVARHARSEHGLTEVPPELVDSVRAAIATVPE